MTDWYANELFCLGADAVRLALPVSRLVVDPERFADDADEPMAGRGMGAVYTSTSDGRPLRASLDAAERERLLQTYYRPHHAMLERLVRQALESHGRCLIIDGHSFPASPLPCDVDQSPVRPDICIGTDDYHTPAQLQQTALEAFGSLRWRVALNRPFSGAMVPGSVHRRDARVHSIMVEVNRSLYMNEDSAERSAAFDEARRKIRTALEAIAASVR